MSLFNWLCQGSPSIDAIGVLVLIFPIIDLILITYGIVKMCNYYKKSDEKSKKEYKKGVIAFIFYLVISIILLIILKATSSSLKDPCENVSPLYTVIKALLNIGQILIPFAYIIISIIELIMSVVIPEKEIKKEYRSKAIRYFAAAFFIFFITFIFRLILEIIIATPEEALWKNCWC